MGQPGAQVVEAAEQDQVLAAAEDLVDGGVLAEQPEQPAGDAAYTVAQAQQSFEFGLARVLDGIEAFIERRSRPPADDL
jgi:hypothetical protein